MSTTDEVMSLADAYATQMIHAHYRPTLDARAALLKAVEALEKDAARYRFLRLNYDDSLIMYGDNSHCEMMMEEELDRAIDSAMQKETP